MFILHFASKSVKYIITVLMVPGSVQVLLFERFHS